jgi:hypothetical protein
MRVVPLNRICLIKSQRFLLACGSNPVVGSSKKIILGLLISVVANEKRCC